MDPFTGALIGGGISALGGLLGGGSSSGSSASATTQPYYPMSTNPSDELYAALMGKLGSPLANVSYGGITKPLYDVTNISTLSDLLKSVLGIGSSTSQGAESGWLGTALNTAGNTYGTLSNQEFLKELFNNKNSNTAQTGVINNTPAATSGSSAYLGGMW